MYLHEQIIEKSRSVVFCLSQHLVSAPIMQLSEKPPILHCPSITTIGYVSLPPNTKTDACCSVYTDIIYIILTYCINNDLLKLLGLMWGPLKSNKQVLLHCGLHGWWREVESISVPCPVIFGCWRLNLVVEMLSS